MSTVYDEVFGPDGQLVSSTERTVAEPAPLIAEIYDTRKQVKAIAANAVPNTTIPIWGRVLAKYMLLITHYLVSGRETEDAPTAETSGATDVG